MNLKQRRYPKASTGVAREGGFTLIELMVTVAVATILVTGAVPTFRNMIVDNRLTAQANDFLSDAYQARGRAVMQGRRVTMCRCVSDATGKCVESGADYTCNKDGSTNWNQGWIVFVDADEDAEHDGPAEQVIRVHDRLAANLDLSGDNGVSDYLSYDRRGIVSTTRGGLQSGTLTLADASQHTDGGKLLKRTITISSSGAVSTCNPNRSSCP